MSEIIRIDDEEFEDIKIGSDPELRFQGIKARNIVPYEGKFGTDGPDSQIGELRPDPTFCPINHVNEIEKILREGYRKFSQLQKPSWFAGSCPEDKPIGGHIHFGSNYKENLDIKLEALDKLLSPVVLMLEDTEKAKKRRTETQYGKLATNCGSLDIQHRGFKTKEHFHGSQHALCHNGYEYRPLPSWLISKQIASGVLSLAKVIGFQTHNKSLIKHLWKQLKFIKNDKKFAEKFDQCDKKFFAPIVPTTYRIIRSFKLFPRYNKYINYLYHLIAQGRQWNENCDLKTKWNIMPIIKQTKKIIEQKLYSLDEIWDNGLNLDFPTAKKAKLFMEENND